MFFFLLLFSLVNESSVHQDGERLTFMLLDMKLVG